jgi:hypothetical protein
VDEESSRRRFPQTNLANMKNLYVRWPLVETTAY